MHHARLYGGLGPGRFDRLRKPTQPITADDQDVLYPTVGELGADTGPEFCAFSGLDPDPQDMLDALHIDSDSDMGRLVTHVAPVADLDHDRI